MRSRARCTTPSRRRPRPQARLAPQFDTIGESAAGAASEAAKLDAQTTALYQHILQLRGFNGGSAGEGTSDDRNASGLLSGLSSEQAKEAYLRGIANTGSTEQDWERVRSQYGFKGGTAGAYMDFGSGTPVTLHGRERVMTESEGQRESGLLAEFRAMRAEFRMLPTLLKAAMQQAKA